MVQDSVTVLNSKVHDFNIPPRSTSLTTNFMVVDSLGPAVVAGENLKTILPTRTVHTTMTMLLG